MNALRERLPLLILLVTGMALLAILFAASEALSSAERRFDAKKAEFEEVSRLASEYAERRALIEGIEEAMRSEAAVPLLDTLETEARGQGLRGISEYHGEPPRETGIGTEERASFRLRGMALGPLIRYLEAIENARADCIVREIRLRRSIENPSRLDAEIIIGILDTR